MCRALSRFLKKRVTTNMAAPARAKMSENRQSSTQSTQKAETILVISPEKVGSSEVTPPEMACTSLVRRLSRSPLW